MVHGVKLQLVITYPAMRNNKHVAHVKMVTLVVPKIQLIALIIMAFLYSAIQPKLAPLVLGPITIVLQVR